MLLKLLTIILLSSQGLTQAAWLSPFFKPGPRAEVKFEEGDPAVISMDEEIDAPITVAIVAGYDGVEKPNIASFILGNNFDLGLDFRRNEDDEWEMIVTNKQDYEQPSMQIYIFNIQIENKRVMVQITINNIFDNAPVITSDSNPCSVPELTDPSYESQCVYNVFDADGVNENQISFEVQGSAEEQRLFDFGRITRKDNFNWEFTLILKETLYYDQRALYNFPTFIFDVKRNQGSFNTIIEVEDLPNMPPKWAKAFASARFEEKTSKSFDVIAIDGDTGINTKICYRIEFEADKDYGEYISIGADGLIEVKKIDRDALENEIYPFEIFAFKCNEPESFVNGSAVIIIDDINDNFPEIYFPTDKTSIQLKEQTFETLYTPSELLVQDIDLGSHATYEIVLTQKDDAVSDYARAFNIVPNVGYQNQSFTLSVSSTALLDYEDSEWQEFDIMIKATEIDFPERFTTKMFKVQLLNWNDELPMFDSEEYTFQVNETVGKDFAIGTVWATDRDIDDYLEYFIVGRIGDSISVDILGGQLSTLIDEAFDYERQTEVFFQIQARDNLQTMGEPTHSTFTQVRIEVLDVNDETPQLTMPRKILSILENVRDAEITREIRAFDPDTTAKLKFTIDWENSFATKPGFVVERQYFEGCFIIEELEEDGNNNVVFGVLSVNPSFEFNIDYEKYEVVYLAITVEDTDQEIMPNSASGILVIQIEDENDNPPEFVDDTLTVGRRAIEEAQQGTLIGNIIAKDIDGPDNNVIQYSISPLEGTPPGWIEIETDTGVIKVAADREIGCDVPPRFTLNYQVKLYDGANETVGEIKIDIIDINNKAPEVGLFDDEIRLYENAASGDVIATVKATDLDRDSPHNLVQYYINYRSYPDLQNYFAVDGESGLLTVELFGDKELDRDNGSPEHFIRVNFEDNFQGNGARNGNQTVIHLILLDVNDNAPQLPVKAEYEVDENADEGFVLDAEFYAPDKDEPDTPNSQVRYEILSIEPVSVENENPANYQDLFSIINIASKYGRLETANPLRGFSGKWKIELRAYDLGDLGDSRVSLSSIAAYYVNVKPFNFNQPSIMYPRNDASIRLDFEAIAVGRALTLIDGRPLSPFEAVDDDAGIFGDITFEITSTDSDDYSSFEMVKLNRKQSELRVIKQMEERTYTINVNAFDGGLANDRVSNVRISFVNKNSEPFFSSNRFATDFTENVEGRDETREIPEAIDLKNLDVTNEEDKFLVYYFIDESYRPEDAALFELDKATRKLSLKTELDRETVDRHEIRIMSTNLEAYPSRGVSENSLLIVEITVNDVNDNPPKFQYDSYAVGVSEQDNLGKILLTLLAIDPDLNDEISYAMLPETLVAVGENLEDAKATAFEVNRVTGALTLNFRVQANMKGYFEFKIEARDLVDHTDEASVKIFVVAEASRVTFVFLNEVEAVRNVDQNVLTEIFSDAYGASCIIDEIQATLFDGVAQERLTDLRVHFVRNDEALEAKEILQKSTDIVFITNLNARLTTLGLNLRGLPEEKATPEASASQVLEIVLAILCAVLGTLLTALIIIYAIKTHGYNRQIKALSENSFGEVANDLKPNPQPLPNTNIFANEKSNPVMSIAKLSKGDIDTQSIISSESDDFAGLPDSKIFDISSQADRTNGRNGINNSSYI